MEIKSMSLSVQFLRDRERERVIVMIQSLGLWIKKKMRLLERVIKI